MLPQDEQQYALRQLWDLFSRHLSRPSILSESILALWLYVRSLDEDAVFANIWSDDDRQANRDEAEVTSHPASSVISPLFLKDAAITMVL